MKNILTRWKSFGPVVICCALTALCGYLSHADAASSKISNPFGFEPSLVSSTIIQGEAIILHYRIAYNPALSAESDIEQSNSAWVTATLENRSRTRNIPLRTPLAEISGCRPAPALTPLHGNVFDHWLILHLGSETPPGPGKYTLTLHVDLGRLFGSGPPLPLGEKSPAPDVQTYVFPVTITAGNHAQIRADAQHWEKVIRAGDVDQCLTAIQSLFGLPAADASPLWEAVVQDRSLDTVTECEVVKAIADLQSPQAYDLLTEVSQDNLLSKGVHEQAALYMDKLYRIADASLKDHIEEILAKQGLKPSPIPLVRLD